MRKGKHHSRASTALADPKGGWFAVQSFFVCLLSVRFVDIAIFSCFTPKTLYIQHPYFYEIFTPALFFPLISNAGKFGGLCAEI
jgi:hypothetical protein